MTASVSTLDAARSAAAIRLRRRTQLIAVRAFLADARQALADLDAGADVETVAHAVFAAGASAIVALARVEPT